MPNEPGSQYLLREGKYRPVDQILKTPRDVALRDMGIGAAFCVGGILVTVVSYSLVSEHGGTYFLLWGPAVFGAIRFFRGVARFFGS
jgi:hypothetical protein